MNTASVVMLANTSRSEYRARAYGLSQMLGSLGRFIVF